MSQPIAEAGEIAGETAPARGFVPPVPTPFKDGRVDTDSLLRVMDDAAEAVSGILVGGSVGEAGSLTVDERIEVMRAVAGHLDKDAFLAVSIADNALENSRRLSEAAGELGADVLMLSCPNYFSNDRAMLEQYFAAVSGFASADICLYDNPIASNTHLSVADIRALAEAAPRLRHVKVTDLALGKVEALRRETSLAIYSGDDAVLWHQLHAGADAAMVALPMIYPKVAAELMARLGAGDTSAALEEYRKATPFIHLALGAPDYVAVVKTVLHHRGVIASPEVRLPLIPLSASRRRDVIAAL